MAGRAAAPWAGRVGADVIVLSEPDDRVDLEPASTGEPVRYELREHGRPRWVLWQYAETPATVNVTIRHGATVVFQGHPS